MLDTLAHLIELQLEVITTISRDEYLDDMWLYSTSGIAYHATIHRNITRRHERKTCHLDMTSHNLHALVTCRLIARQEQKTCTILSALRDWNTMQKDKLMRYLSHDTCTITTLTIGTLSTSVAHILENLQSILDNIVTLISINIYNKSHTACIMLKLWIIQTLRLWHRTFCLLATHKKVSPYLGKLNIL